MTCFRRSERMTSPRFTILATASFTSTQGSLEFRESSVVLVSPVRLVYE